MGDHRHRSRVADDLALRGRAVGVAKLVDANAGDLPSQTVFEPIRSIAQPFTRTAPASPAPAASGAAKNSGSSAIVRPIVRAGSPLAA